MLKLKVKTVSCWTITIMSRFKRNHYAITLWSCLRSIMFDKTVSCWSWKLKPFHVEVKTVSCWSWNHYAITLWSCLRSIVFDKKAIMFKSTIMILFVNALTNKTQFGQWFLSPSFHQNFNFFNNRKTVSCWSWS